MTSQDVRGPTLRDTARRALRPILAALVTGVAEPPPPPPRRWPKRLPYAWVVPVANLFVGWVILLGTYSVLDDADNSPGSGTMLFVSVLLAVPVVLRIWHPVAAWRLLLVPALWSSSWRWLDEPFIPGAVFAAMLCLYSVASRAPTEVTLGAGAISLAGVAAVEPRSAGAATLLVLPPLLAGYLVRERRRNRARLAEQEKRHQEAEAVLFERQRIARELHDVVAHHMSMIAIQAEAAPYKVTGVPAETRQDLAEIRATALEALTELRRVLGVLRSEDGAETAPQPGLDRLDDLVANARGAGLTVDFKETGEAGNLPPGYGLTIYRIAQEALSNAMRHAPESHVDIEVEHPAGAVRLSVVNGPPPSGAAGQSPGGGHGLIGMRERAGMLGGELIAEPTREGGFVVVATLPVHASEGAR